MELILVSGAGTGLLLVALLLDALIAPSLHGLGRTTGISTGPDVATPDAVAPPSWAVTTYDHAA